MPGNTEEIEELIECLNGGYFMQISALNDIARALAILLAASKENKL